MTIYRKYFLLILVFLQSHNLFAQDLIFSSSDHAPYIYSGGKEGILVRVLREMGKRSGIGIVLESLPSERGLQFANLGLVDGEANRITGLTKYYPNLIEIPAVLSIMEFVAFSEQKISGGTGWLRLTGQTVGIIGGWKIAERKLATRNKLVKVRTPQQLFQLLRLGRVDAIVYERYQGLSILRQHNLIGQFSINLLESIEMHLYIISLVYPPPKAVVWAKALPLP